MAFKHAVSGNGHIMHEIVYSLSLRKMAPMKEIIRYG